MAGEHAPLPLTPSERGEDLEDLDGFHRELEDFLYPSNWNYPCPKYLLPEDLQD